MMRLGQKLIDVLANRHGFWGVLLVLSGVILATWPKRALRELRPG